MNLSPREMMLVWLTLAAVLLGGSFWLGEPMYQDWKDQRSARSTLHDRQRLAERLLEQKTDIQERWESLRAAMPSYPLDLDVTSQLLRNLQQTADKQGLILVRVEPDEEVSVGDLYEVSIACSWEGSLDALVKFLYDVQAESGMVDTRQITVTPTRGNDGRLKGNMVVDYAYSRSNVTPESTPAVEEPVIEVKIGS